MTIEIDAHVHVWTRSTDPQPWIDSDTMAAIDRDFTIEDLDAMLDQTGARSAVVVQSSNSFAETRRLLDSAGDRVAGVVGWLDLHSDVEVQLDMLSDRQRHNLVGIRHLAHIDPDPMWLGRSDVQVGLAALGRAGLTFDLVLQWPQLELAANVAGNLPDVQFVLDHLGNPPLVSAGLAQWEQSLRALAASPNTSAKLSGVAACFGSSDWTASMCRPAIEVALDAFGPDRLMYGSDWPVVELVGGSQRWKEAVAELIADLSPGEREAINGATAARIYGVATE